MSEELKGKVEVKTHYCIEVMLFAGMLSLRGTAPPPSRKLTDCPELPPLLVDAKPPLKYGRRSTAVPSYSPGARMPATETPTFGLVSEDGGQQ